MGSSDGTELTFGRERSVLGRVDLKPESEWWIGKKVVPVGFEPTRYQQTILSRPP
jgi:hypothetical protein